MHQILNKALHSTVILYQLSEVLPEVDFWMRNMQRSDRPSRQTFRQFDNSALLKEKSESRGITFTAGSGSSPQNASGTIIENDAIRTMVAGLVIELAPKVSVNAVAPT